MVRPVKRNPIDRNFCSANNVVDGAKSFEFFRSNFSSEYNELDFFKTAKKGGQRIEKDTWLGFNELVFLFLTKQTFDCLRCI